MSRAQMTRSGHVYIISNIGSFGEDIYKIGMTRRLVPEERIQELGDASVPFPFDIHALIFCEDAPTLETKLHNCFDSRRINQVNLRKEFFRVSLAEIQEVVRQNHGEIEFTLIAQADEYRKTQALVAQNGRGRRYPSLLSRFGCQNWQHDRSLRRPPILQGGQSPAHDIALKHFKIIRVANDVFRVMPAFAYPEHLARLYVFADCVVRRRANSVPRFSQLCKVKSIAHFNPPLIITYFATRVSKLILGIGI
jgi:hypothetical protein